MAATLTTQSAAETPAAQRMRLCDNSSTAVASPQRTNKPSPLTLVAAPTSDANDVRSAPYRPPPSGVFRPLSYNGLPMPQQPQSMTIEEVLELIEHINQSVKAGQFTTHLASDIYRLCQQLKISGECMERSHKDELNRVFVSLRQACCRDAGQLGTPCRLKIMEVVELRAMNWRPSLSHSQYYLNRNAAAVANEYHHAPQHLHSPHSTLAAGCGGVGLPAVTVGGVLVNASQRQLLGHDDASAFLAGAAPVSAPPFGAVPVNPFTLAAPPPFLQQQQMDLANNNAQHQAPSYYLIPASGGFLPQALVPGAAFFPPPPSPIATSAPQQPFGSPQQPPSPADVDTPWPKGAVTKPSVKFGRPQKVPGKNQFRDEICIRNADSGKIMGVKGRRVAVVEEMSQTVISFQKVATGAKERTLTVTGNSEEAIRHAKVLIDETIRRNVSPNRFDASQEDGAAVAASDDVAEENLSFSIEKGADGSLKLSCQDPDMLQAAQEALNVYLTRRRTNTVGDDDLRRERRKSMSALTIADGSADHRSRAADINLADEAAARPRLGSVHAAAEVDPFNAEAASENGQQRRVTIGATSTYWLPKPLTKSTPNLAKLADAKNGDERKWRRAAEQTRCSVNAVYGRDFVMRCADSPLAAVAPGNMRRIAVEAPDILREESEDSDDEATAFD